MESLTDVRARTTECRRCPLSGTRTKPVFGSGAPHARVMLIGEAPGRQEDRTGEPFVGAAGALLDELLVSAGMKRDDVYIANVLKCRPPGNRDPLPAEIEACAPLLREQVRVVAPEIIVTLGNFATRFVLKTTEGITRLRGVSRRAGRFLVLPVFHPAAALYDVRKRDALFADFALLPGLLRDADARAGDSGSHTGAGSVVSDPAGEPW